MSENTKDEYRQLIENFDEQEKDIKRQITFVEMRQTEIQNYISTMENFTRQMEQLINKESDKEKRGRMYGSIRSNIELISKLYGNYREFEDIKAKYLSCVTDIIYKKHHLVEVDIRRIDENADRQTPTDVMHTISELVEVMKNRTDLIMADMPEFDDPAYKL